MVNIDINKLRRDLLDYFGVAMFSVSGFAIMDLIEVERADNSELINLAIKHGFNLDDYDRTKTLVKRI